MIDPDSGEVEAIIQKIDEAIPLLQPRKSESTILRLSEVERTRLALKALQDKPLLTESREDVVLDDNEIAMRAIKRRKV